MKKVALLFPFMLGLAVLLPTSTVMAQWVQSGPFGGSVHSIAVSPTRTYVGTEAGVCFTTDACANWTIDNYGLTDTYVQAMAICGQKVFAGTADSGVYVKDNAGSIWTRTTLTESVYSFAVSGGNIFAGCEYAGVYRSTDNGTSWSKVNNGLTDTYVRSILAVNTTIYVGTADAGLFVSTDNGANWSPSNNGLPGSTPYSLAFDGSKMYAGIWASGLYVSSDNGGNWIKSNGGLSTTRDYHFYSIVTNGGKVFAGGAEGVYLSTDSGANWTEVNKGIPMYKDVNTLAFCGTNLVAGISDSGVFVSSDNGSNWSSSNVGLPRYEVNVLLVKGDTLFAGTNGGVYSSTDDGSTWDANMGGSHSDQYASVSALMLHSDTLFAGDLNGYVYYSSNNGQNWYTLSQVERGAIITSLLFSGSDLFATTSPYDRLVAGGVYRSSDRGSTWTPVNSGLPTLADNFTTVSGVVKAGTSLFVATGEGVYGSSDNGSSWVPMNNGIETNTQNYIYAKWISSLVARGTELFAGLNTVDGGGVFRSSDFGATWTKAGLDKPIYTLGNVDTLILVLDWDDVLSNVYVLANKDSSWRQIGFSNNNVLSYAALNGKLYLGTTNAVWQTPMSHVLSGLRPVSTQLPTRFSLLQNYPNPFNPATAITYQLSAVSQVTLKIYDVLGREVRTLVSERQSAGTHTVSFDGSGLSSGVYFYRLVAGAQTSTMKMILMK